MKSFFLKAVCAAIVLAGVVASRADVLYQDTTVPTGNYLTFANNQQIGEQIWLGTLTPEYLTNFSFEYYDPNNTLSWNGSVQADVRFYENNGTPTNGFNTPGTLFYDSGLFSIPTPYSISLTNTATLNFDLSDLQFPPGGSPLDPNFILPTNFTFTVTFSGLAGGDQVGLSIYEPPTVGTNYGDYWFDSSGTWELLTNTVPVAFGAQFNGSIEPTPEPSVICLGVLGGTALMAMARRRRV